MKLRLRSKPTVYVRVYTGEGKRAHLAAEPVTEVLCRWPADKPWRGTASGAERQVAAALPTCHMCADILEHLKAGA